MKDRAARGDGGIAALPDFDLLLHRRLDVVRVYRPTCDGTRVVDLAKAIANKCSAGRASASYSGAATAR